MKSKHLYLDNDTLALIHSIKKERVKLGLTLRELAPLIGVDWSTIKDYESGRNHPTLANFLKLAQFFGWDISNNINFLFLSLNKNLEKFRQLVAFHNISQREFQRLTHFSKTNLWHLFNGKGTVHVFATLKALLDEENRLADFRHYSKKHRKKVSS